MTDTHAPFIRESIALANAAVAKGNEPFGALLVKDGEVVLRAENTIATGHDPTNHAEMNLVRLAVAQFDADFLAQCTLYTSTEPCAMCAGAIYWGNIGRIVFGCSESRLMEIAGGGLGIDSRNVLANASRSIEIVGPVIEDEAVQPHLNYWK